MTSLDWKVNRWNNANDKFWGKVRFVKDLGVWLLFREYLWHKRLQIISKLPINKKNTVLSKNTAHIACGDAYLIRWFDCMGNKGLQSVFPSSLNLAFIKEQNLLKLLCANAWCTLGTLTIALTGETLLFCGSFVNWCQDGLSHGLPNWVHRLYEPVIGHHR